MRTLMRLPDRASRSRRLTRQDLPAGAHDALGSGNGAVMRPLPVPLSVGGAGGAAYEGMASLLRLGGRMPVQGQGRGNGGGEKENRLKPGAPVGAVWVTGDLELAAMGTATMVEDGRVVAFGHPMSGTGRSNLPLAVGRVQAVIPSYYRSFRLASIEHIVGRMTQDRQAGVVGRVGEEAPMFPCTVHGSITENSTRGKFR